MKKKLLYSIILVPLSLYIFSSCKSEPTRSTDLESETKIIVDEGYVLRKAKIFLHIMYGATAIEKYYRDDLPSKVFFDEERQVWHVNFYASIASVSIEMDAEANKGNYTRSEDLTITKNPDDKLDNFSPPLYTLEEMITLLSLPHNIPKLPFDFPLKDWTKDQASKNDKTTGP